MSSLNEFFDYKIAALLHDPVNKAWLLVEGENHEEKAKMYAMKLLEGSNLSARIGSILAHISDRRSKHVVGRADALASSIDRWVISILTTYKDQYLHGVFKVNRADIIKNVIDPRYKIKLRKPKSQGISEFIRELSNILKHFKDDKRLLYHVLYALYEVIFYNKVGEEDIFVGSAADTRCPTHTVFDHAYATTTMINIIKHRNGIVEHDEPSKFLNGYVVVVDLAGVQKYLMASRKLRDLWISSWFASMLAWTSIWPLILALGPDILVTPSPRNNPFYYSYLLAVIKSRLEAAKNKVIVERISNYFSKAIGKLNKDIPRFGVIPTQLVLLLPPINIIREGLKEITNDEKLLPKDIRKKLLSLVKCDEKWKNSKTAIIKVILGLYKTLWEKLVSKIMDEVLNPKYDLTRVLEKILREYNEWDFEKLREAFNTIRNYPPLPIRIVVLSIEEILCSEDSIEYYEIYDKIIAHVREKLSEISTVKYDYPPMPPIERIYKHIKEGAKRLSRRGFEYCSVCGVIPAILRMPSSDEWDQKWKEKLRELAVSLESIVAPGERICVYDLVKRLLSIHDIFNSFIRDVIHENISELELMSFPTTAHIALADFYDKLKEYLLKKPEEIAQLIRELRLPRRFMKPYGYLEKILREISKVFGEESDELAYMSILMSMDPELTLLSVEGRRTLRKLMRESRKVVGKPIRLNTYVAIIRADADNMGKILRGEVKEALYLDPIDYILESLEGGAQEIVKCLREEKIDEAIDKLAKEYERYNIPNAFEVAKYNIKRLERLIYRLKEENRILLTPAYHVSLSRALMLCALIDQYIVESDTGKGFIVYSGGDDLLALTPIATSLDVIVKTRRSFSIGFYESEGHVGFISLEMLRKVGLSPLIVPLIVNGGRSYSLTFIHYRYPLYMGLSISSKLLEEKDRVEWIIFKVNEFKQPENVIKKDIMNLSYISRGLKMLNSLLPLKLSKRISNINDIATIIEYLNKSYNEVEEGKLSRSLIYDLQHEKESLNKILDKGLNDLYDKLLEYIISRNCVEDVDVNTLSTTKLLKHTKYLKVRINDEEQLLVLNVIDAIKLFDSAIRGVE